MIKLPTTKQGPVRDWVTKRLLIYGVPKIGKSQFAAEFPDAAFLCTEKGQDEFEAYKLDCFTWEQLVETIDVLISQKPKHYKTIVLDTVDDALRLCEDFVCRTHLKKDGSKPAHVGEIGKDGAGYVPLRSEFTRMITNLINLPYGIILLGHLTEYEEDTPVGKKMKIAPSIYKADKRLGPFVAGKTDMIFCIQQTREGKRYIHTKPTPTIVAGSRYGLPERLPFSYAAIKHAYENLPEDRNDLINEQENTNELV